MDETLATFHNFGKYALIMQPITIIVRGSARYSATKLTDLVGIWSGPVEQSCFRVLMVFSTSSLVTQDRRKRAQSVESSGKLSTKSASSRWDVAVTSRGLCAATRKGVISAVTLVLTTYFAYKSYQPGSKRTPKTAKIVEFLKY